MIKHKIPFLVLWAVHFSIATGSLFWSFTWGMGLLDSMTATVAPWGLQALSYISIVFGIPLLFFFGATLFGSPSIPLIIATLLLNSFVVCYFLVFVWEKVRQNKQV